MTTTRTGIGGIAIWIALVGFSGLAATAGRSHAMITGKILIDAIQLTGAGSGFRTPVTAGCPSGDTCYALSGSVVGTPIGSGSFSATVDSVTTPNVTNNGSGGTCTPASGTMTVKFGMIGSITMLFVGNLCQVGAPPHSPNVGPLTLDASFFATGGTGSPFKELNGNSGAGEGGAGTGRLTFSGDIDDGDVLLSLAGTLSFSPVGSH